MKIFRKPRVNAAVIVIISAFYAFLFDLISGHVEFERLLNHVQSLESPFWNGWSAFLKQGNVKYIGYAYVAAAVVIAVLSLLRKRDYDEYQGGLLEKGFIAMAAVMVFVIPVMLILILSDPLYSVETVMFLAVLHWSVVLLADLIYVIGWSRL